MSEEKKAIEYFKEIIKQTERANECGLSTNDFSEEIKIYNTVLNLIEKKNEDIQRMQELLDKSDARNVELNKEIENLKNLNKHQSNDMTKAVDYTFELNK